MAQEFTIKSEAIESKINQLLPTQGGFQPGVDFSASTMIMPIIDLTETAEGSGLRQDLQTALSINNTSFAINNAVGTSLITTPGYYRVIGHGNLNFNAGDLTFFLDTGFTTTIVQNFECPVNVGSIYFNFTYDFIVKVQAGETFKGTATTAFQTLSGSTRQIADINGNLVTP